MKFAILTLAKFHAIGLSIKYKKPSYLTRIAKYAKHLPIQQKMMGPFLQETLAVLRADPEIGLYAKRVDEAGDVDRMDEKYYMVLEPTNPWACVVHSDFWINNILFHRDERTGEVDDAKMVDFQTFFISSPLVDLVFLICTSMVVNVTDFNELSEFYRNAVLEVLEFLGCHEAIPLFAKESFEARLKIDAISEMHHVILFAKVVELREGEEINISPLNDGTIGRLRRVIKLYVEKDWI